MGLPSIFITASPVGYVVSPHLSSLPSPAAGRASSSSARASSLSAMTTDKGRPLPKFGEWDVKNPASAEGFTVIFQKARDDKKTTGPGHAQAGIPPAFRNNGGAGGYRPDFKSSDSYQYTPPKRVKKKWFFCT